MRSKVLLGLVLIVAMSAAPAQAALISLDSSFGAGSITRDTQTGLQWLDLTYSMAYTYDEVVAQTGAGGLFAGFRVATGAEVLTLFQDAGIPYLQNYYPEDYAPVSALMDLVGVTGPCAVSDCEYAEGHISDVSPVLGYPYALADLIAQVTPLGNIGFAGIGYITADGEATRRDHGTWLVQESTSVPDPASTLLLLGMGLAGLACWRKR